MKFYELPVNSKFTVQGSNQVYEKVKEVRKSCCKVQCNAKSVGDAKEVVFKPMQNIEEVNKEDAN